MESTWEVLPVGGRGRRNRKWSDDLKGRIVAETLKPAATVAEVARRHGVPANHVSSWRLLAKKGRLVLPAPEDPVEFAALMVGPSEVAARTMAVPKIVPGSVVIRFGTRRINRADRCGRTRLGGWRMIFP